MRSNLTFIQDVVWSNVSGLDTDEPGSDFVLNPDVGLAGYSRSDGEMSVVRRIDDVMYTDV